MTNCAPVLIITLNRYVHFSRCIKSLSACTDADKTDLYIALDYPLKVKDWDGYKKIDNYIKTIKTFKNVNIIKRNENYGAVKNFFDSVAQIFKKHDKLIFSEDDNEFSPNFLNFINNGLNKFANNPLVNAICGYNYPFNIPKNYTKNYYFSQGFSTWGFGIWKTKFESFDWDITNLNRFLHNPLNVIKLNNIQYDLLIGLMNIVKSGNITGDRMHCYNNIIKGAYSVFPSISKVRNFGHDGSGVHCSNMLKQNIFVSQLIDNKKTFDYDTNEELENDSIYKELKRHNYNFTKNNYIKRFKLLIKYLLFLMDISFY